MLYRRATGNLDKSKEIIIQVKMLAVLQILPLVAWFHSYL